MTGYDVVLELRKIRFDIPIILCTGSGEDEVGERQPASGITHFLAKPIRMHDMAEAINAILSKDELRGCDRKFSA
jgi:FixJ family two-component response regulator